MELKKAKAILEDERKHCISHLNYSGKAKEYYEEMQDLVNAYSLAIELIEKHEKEGGENGNS